MMDPVQALQRCRRSARIGAQEPDRRERLLGSKSDESLAGPPAVGEYSADKLVWPTATEGQSNHDSGDEHAED